MYGQISSLAYCSGDMMRKTWYAFEGLMLTAVHLFVHYGRVLVAIVCAIKPCVGNGLYYHINTDFLMFGFHSFTQLQNLVALNVHLDGQS